MAHEFNYQDVCTVNGGGGGGGGIAISNKPYLYIGTDLVC